jgi:Ca2+-binding EF-hand superfamily protein
LGAVAAAVLAVPGFAGDKDGDKWKSMDSNNDGFITQAEHAAGARQMFEKMDGDRDGRVTSTEMQEAHDMHARDTAQHQASHEGRYDKGKTSKMSPDQMMKKVDSNKDGAISASEHEESSRRMFTEMDTDGDGRLSKDEMKKGHERMMRSEGEDEPSKY